jgi:hypothetical protein
VESLIPVRPFLHFSWGDGTLDSIAVPATSSNYFISIFEHYYQNVGDYIVSINEPYYVSNISNIQNSNQEPLRIENMIRLNPDIGINSSPLFTYPQEGEWKCCNWNSNAGAFDSDPNDSLTFELIPCLVSNYTFPNENINPQTGDLIFTPDTIGKYALAFRVNEWRRINNSDQLIGTTTRQLLLNVNSLVGIDENDLESDFSIYPSPTHDNLIVSGKFQSLNLKVFDITGRQVIDRKNYFPESMLDFSKLSIGMYLLIIQTEAGKVVKKLIKE